MRCKVEKDILFYALEYSLGRRTFAPVTVMSNVQSNIDEFEDWELENMIKRIDSHEQLHGNLGSESDKKDWYDFKDYLNRKLTIRKKMQKLIDSVVKSG